MKTIDSGYGNSGDLLQARQKALQGKTCRYITIVTSGGTPRVLGSSFHYEISGTDSAEEILEPSIFRLCNEVIDVETGKGIEKAQLAKQYLKSLNEEQRAALVDKMLVNFLVK